MPGAAGARPPTPNMPPTMMTMNAFKRLLLPLLLLAGSSALAQTLSMQPLDRVIAVVDETVILRSELDRAIGNILSQYASRPEQLPPRDVLERQVLDRIILIKLQAQRARDTGIRVSEVEIDNTIGSIASQNGMSIDQLRHSLAQDGFTYSEFRETVREELLLQRLRGRFIQTQVAVSDSEIDNLLASGQLQRGDVHLGHILIAVPDGADAETLRIGREKAEGVHRLIQDGMDFAAAAIRYSNAPNALDGGDLGWRTLTEVPLAFVDLVEQMQEGDVTPPIRGPSGFHILKLYERRAQTQRMVEEFHARHILVRVDELTSDEDAHALIQRLHEQLQNGADFAELARQHSDDHTTAPLGGDMGWFPIDGYGQGVARQLPLLADGGMSEPFRTDAGWHILQRLATRQQDRTEELLRRQAEEMIRTRKAEEEYERFLRQLRNEAYIENRLTAAQAGGS